MLSIVVAFPKLENAKSIKNLLIRNGYDVSAVCTSGAQVLNTVNNLDEGIILCGYRFADMHYQELHEYLPKGFQMLLIASKERLETCINNQIVCLGTPIHNTDLLNTLEMMTYQDRRRRKKEKTKERTEQDKNIILKAKLLLMERNNLSEEDAYRYIQKTSMDSGTNMVETAQMILSIMER